LLEFFSPLLVGAANALQFLFRYLIVVVVKDGVVLEYLLHRFEEDRHVLTPLKQLEEEASVALEDVCNHF
jgi:hypothetical protein